MRCRYEPKMPDTDRVEKILHNETNAFLRFIKAARKHSVSLRQGNMVLYVENDPDSQSILKSIIEHACNEIETDRLGLITAFSTEEAKEQIKKRYFELKVIITDLDFNHGCVDGFALLQWIHDEFGDLIPVLVLTGHDEAVPEIRERFKNVEVLVKPASSAKILEAIFHESAKE